ncbi:hypothetical protein PILCRDRAFT_5220 [Piloderma croceum F 1598]|uniref:C2 domain-containing protein n=1 Tax=Piloderma croceum (strain F 1598) TaxID=765440 RepID=A0A0C3FPY1_PILCF|nr:hypothetical protein PILCRDRAFT_5220 [Piloderma croceum F 1598]
MSEIKRKVRLTVIKASKLPQSYRVKAPNCYAAISVDGGPVQQTECKTGINPEWGDSHFDLEVLDSSTIEIAVFRLSKRPFSKTEAIPMGGIILSMGNIFAGNKDMIEHTYQLQKNGTSKSGKYGNLLVRLQLLEAQSEVVQEPGQSRENQEHGQSSNDQPDEPKLPLEDQVVDLFDEADHCAAKLSNVKGMSVVENATDTVNTSITIEHSDGFALVCGYVEQLMKIGDVVSKVHPWASLAWSILSVIPKTLIAQVRRDEKVQSLWETAADMLAFLKDAKPIIDKILMPIVSDMMKQIYHCAIFVREYGGGGFFERTAKDMLNSSDNVIAQYAGAFQQLKERFDARSHLSALKVLRDVSQGVVQLSDILDDMRDMEQIKSLENIRGPDLEGVRCDKYAICLPATRKALLSEIMQWVTKPDGERTLWLHGVAGSGKSTVANTITSMFTEMGLLGASFRFNQHIEPKYLFRNIAYQLAIFDSRYRERLLQAIRKHGTMASYSLREQSARFIIEPMNAIRFVGPVVIVIDGVDESGVENERREVLEAIAKELPNLPSFIRVLLTSRDERDIRAELAPACFPKCINDVEGTTGDIKTYIDDQMRNVIKSHTYLETHWPGHYAKKALGTRADGLFIWITVASEYIKASLNPDQALDDVLSGQAADAQPGPEAPLDKLYLGILQRTPALLYYIDATKYVLGSILVAKTPLTQTGLDSLLGLGRNVVQTLQDGGRIRLTSSASMIHALGSILRVDDKGIIRVLHASVIDFFTNPSRCTDERFFIDRTKYNHQLTICCFKAMDDLKQDICAVDDPTKFNSEIDDLDERLIKHLPEHLRYACRSWHWHLTDITESNDVYNQAKGFLFTHLLHWIEVMSLLDDINDVFLGLENTKSWLQNHSNREPGVGHLVDDTLLLMHRFHEPIRRASAHVYYSAIPLTPPSSMVFEVYAPKLKNIPKLISGDVLSATSKDIRLPSSTVSFSLDRSWVACADPHGGAEIRDVATGVLIHGPLSGLDEDFASIDFSHNGTRFCASNASCVVVWDATTYEIMGAPIQLTSPGNVRLWEDTVIVLSWGDNQVSIWEIETGTLVVDYKITVDHEYAYAVDLQGTYLVVPTPEQTISIIYATTGDDITKKYAHGRIIKEAMFSPDNTRVFCLYHDDSHVTILDVHSGSIIGDSIDVDRDHFSKFRVAFSPKGKRFVAVKGKSATIYNVDTGKLMHGPFEREHKLEGADLSIEETRLLIWEERRIFEVLDVPSGNVIATGNRRGDCLLSRHGDHVITYSRYPDRDTAITIFDVNSLSNDSDGTRLACVTPSPTGHQLLFTYSDNTLRLKVDISSTKPVVLEGARSPAAFSPEGSVIVTAYSDHALQLWGTKDTKAIGKSLVGHRKRITAIAFSPTGSRLISASDDYTIRIWSSTSEGGELLRLQAYTDIQLISMSSDESRIICVSRDNIVQTLNANTGIAISQPSRPRWTQWAEFSSGGSEIIWISTDGQSRSTECQTGRITEHAPASSAQRITEVVFSPDKIHFISISNHDLIDFSDGTNSCESSSTSSLAVQTLTFSSDGRWLMSVILEDENDFEDDSWYRACMWDSRSGQLVWEDLLSFGRIPSVAISPSGNMAVIWNDSVCNVRDTLLGTIISRWDTQSVPESVAFSQDEKHIICILDASGTSEKWDIESSALLDSSEGTDAALEPASARETIQGSAISPDGKRLAVAHRCWTLAIHDVTDNTNTVIFEILDSPIRSPTFSPDGIKFAAVVADRVIHIWDTITRNLLNKSQKHSAYIQSLVLSPDGTRIILNCSDSSDMTVQIWLVTEDLTITLDKYKHEYITRLAAFFPDGMRFLTSSKQKIWIWDMPSTTPVLVSTLTADSMSIYISSDGARLLLDDCLWDLVNDRRITSWTGHAITAKFSPDCKLAAFRDENGVHILDATTGAKLYKHLFVNDIDCRFSFSLDSTRLLSSSSYRPTQVFDLRSLPTSVGTEFPSCVYPPDCMMIQSQSQERDGWYYGPNGGRLIWLPHNMRPVWLATGKQPFGSRRLFLGSGSDVAVLDVDDYLEVLPAGVAWREAGIRYLENPRPFDALMSKSGNKNIAFNAPCPDF